MHFVGLTLRNINVLQSSEKQYCMFWNLIQLLDMRYIILTTAAQEIKSATIYVDIQLACFRNGINRILGEKEGGGEECY